MVSKSGKLILSLLFVGVLYTTVTDAAVSWTKPALGDANGDGTLTVDEDQATDDTIETYAATTDAHNVTFALTLAVSPFALTEGGVLTITDSLDHETKPTYILHIVATDNGGASRTATITVTVTDVNEHDPVFSPASYSACIVDASPADTTLTTVTATDGDTSQTLTYAIDSGNTNTDFKIVTSSGLIQVEVGKTLDKATTASYDLVVTAADDLATIRTVSTTVSITVADSCDSGTAVVAVSMVMLFVSLIVTLF